MSTNSNGAALVSAGMDIFPARPLAVAPIHDFLVQTLFIGAGIGSDGLLPHTAALGASQHFLVLKGGETHSSIHAIIAMAQAK